MRVELTWQNSSLRAVMGARDADLKKNDGLEREKKKGKDLDCNN